ncbi:structure-specific endonuclease subunit SLX4 isoform X2 [Betta splendens]|uniref:Structure-specific endonuclease subunit SLX4 n=1 Tax=Betta splendens TaxID=158456 RepID=A0A9W2XTH7_BETSP|nr:structure-specific endonuclease subunit SLX4 isoform X2 [Betta splendens]
MDDSEQDFVDLCSKLLKRVRKKAGEPRPPRKADHQLSSQTSDGKNSRRNKNIGASKSKPVEPLVSEGTGHGSGDAGSSSVPSTGLRYDGNLTAKDKVLDRMQQFKRDSPQRMVCTDKRQPTNNYVPRPQPQMQESLESFTSGLNPEPQDTDEDLALRLQQELDREAAEAQTVALKDGGVFFCQICYKDLSHMSPEGRTQHLNRCLDEREESAPHPPPPSVPECPICGKKFKSQKSRLAHLKCCYSEMGISPAVMLQALQRQAADTQNVFTTNRLPTNFNAITKRKGNFKRGFPVRKKAKNKTGPLDEDTMMALALSASLLEEEREQQRESKAEIQMQAETTVHPTSPVVRWKTELGAVKGRGKLKKGPIRHPPPLLVQDAQEALKRLQERVSALLLRSWPDSPPTPTRCQSGLSGWTGAAPLWQKSSLLDCSTDLSDFYTSELRQFIVPWEPTKSHRSSCNTSNKPRSSLQPVNEGTPDTKKRVLSPSFQTVSYSSPPSTPGTRPVSSQALLDLMELTEDGMTLTQCGYTAFEHNKGVRLNGFVSEEAEEPAVHCVSGFIPEATHRKSDMSGADKKCDGHQSVAPSRLAADLSSMVNNPQLSDVQLQVDSGDVYFAHSFMLYARCPLLAEMVHEVGFGVQEEGSPAAQRVLMSDLPGQAVFALLQYLYTGFCTISASLRPHVLELAYRFDLLELKQLCDLHQDETDYQEDVNNQTNQAFMELLRSMWHEEDEGEAETDTDGANNEQMVFSDQWVSDLTLGHREISEEKVNEEELDEIYEFAATQRKRGEVKDCEGEKDGGDVIDSNSCSSEKSPELKAFQSNPSLDRSYNDPFPESWGVYEEGQSSSLSLTSGLSKMQPPVSQQHQPLHKPSSNLSSRALFQSLASVVDELSPPPTTANLPITGVSPGQVGDCGRGEEKKTDAVQLEECPTLKQQSKGPHVCVALSPDSPHNINKREPELIVLSDSSEEMEVVACRLKDTQTYTQIKSQRKVNEPAYGKKKLVSLKLSPGDPVDCSPELSWLIPSSPAQQETSTRSSTSQSRSSKCRTQLFPQDEASSSPCVFSSAVSGSILQTSDRVSNLGGLAEDSVSRVKLDKMLPSRSNLDLKCCPKRSSSSDLSNDRDIFTVPKSPHTFINISSVQALSKQATPLHMQPQPYSSTPLHADICQPPGHLDASTLHTGPNEKAGEEREKATSEREDSPEKTELGSFHLSPLSDQLHQPSLDSSFCLSRLSSQRQIKFFRETGRIELETGEKEEAKGECGEAGSSECSFQQSFIDEPPIAFNDSWGLDACIDENPCCISLRLEDSGGSSQQNCTLGQGGTTKLLSSSSYHPPPSSGCVQSSKSCDGMVDSSPSKQLTTSIQAHTSTTTPQINSLLNSKLWDSWEEEEEEEVAPLSQRVNSSAHLKTPSSSLSKKCHSLVPITPLPHYSDMDTPELKSKLKRFGVRPLPKRQMILKLKEIHQYTHQLVSSDSEDEPPSVGHTAQMKSLVTGSAAAPNRPVSCTQTGKFKEPSVPATISPMKPNRSKEEEVLSASQGSNTSSTAASEESERSNPELCLSSNEDSDSDIGISASQAANCLEDRLRAVRSFILSDSALYSQILQYQPLVLSQLQERLKANGIRLGAAKLVDYLDSQCVTFTTAKPGQSAPCHKRGKRTRTRAKTADKGVVRRKKGTALI